MRYLNLVDRKYSIIDSLVHTICCPVGVCLGVAECRIEIFEKKVKFLCDVGLQFGLNQRNIVEKGRSISPHCILWVGVAHVLGVKWRAERERERGGWEMCVCVCVCLAALNRMFHSIL